MTRPARVRPAGDAAFLFTLQATIDPDVNARVIALAEAVRARRLNGVRDVVSTFGSVAVYFDPSCADRDEIAAALEDLPRVPAAGRTGRDHEIPVAYGGDDGPDLAEVAAHAGLSADEAIRRHAGVIYRVFMLGFRPGFAYMGLVDPLLAIPRRPTPRLRVPAGSVGIAGRQTGIYPESSPGGWQLIGRALEPVFDRRRQPAARFAPGDRVRFTPSSNRAGESVPRAVTEDVPHGRCVTVLQPGLLTTVQDQGLWGEQGLGVPVGGAMDPVSHGIANTVAGNEPTAAALEVTLLGPEIQVRQDTLLAIAGADLSATVDGAAIPLQTPVRAPAGSTLRFGRRVAGARAYVAFDGGIRLRGSSPVRVGAGDVLDLGPPGGHPRGHTVRAPLPAGGARLRVIPGPQDDQLPAGCLESLAMQRFVVSPQSDRMGYRLAGGHVPAARGEMISDATFPGGIQVPPSGEPILLMADRQTTGGYPQLATVIGADLPVAGQLAPGDWVEFVPCSQAEARAALVAQRSLIHVR